MSQPLNLFHTRNIGNIIFFNEKQKLDKISIFYILALPIVKRLHNGIGSLGIKFRVEVGASTLCAYDEWACSIKFTCIWKRSSRSNKGIFSLWINVGKFLVCSLKFKGFKWPKIELAWIWRNLHDNQTMELAF